MPTAACTQNLTIFPDSPDCKTYTHGEPGIFSHVNMTIKIGPEFLELKGNALRVIQPLCIQRSVCMIFAPR